MQSAKKIKDIIIHFQSKQTFILKENCRSFITHGGNAILRLKDFSRQIATHNRFNFLEKNGHIFSSNCNTQKSFQFPGKIAIFSCQMATHRNPLLSISQFLVKSQRYNTRTRNIKTAKKHVHSIVLIQLKSLPISIY